MTRRRWPELAPIVDGKPDVSKVSSIDLEALARGVSNPRKIIFEAARDVYDLMRPILVGKPGVTHRPVGEVGRTVSFCLTGYISRLLCSITMTLPGASFITLNMTKVVQHVWEAVRVENTERLEPVFDRDHPIRSTGSMATWYTGKPCHFTDRSHINMCGLRQYMGGF